MDNCICYLILILTLLFKWKFVGYFDLELFCSLHNFKREA